MTCSHTETHLYGISNGSIDEWTEVFRVNDVKQLLAQPTTSNNQNDWNINLIIQRWDIEFDESIRYSYWLILYTDFMNE